MATVIAVPEGFQPEVEEGAAELGLPARVVTIGHDGSGIDEAGPIDVILRAGRLEGAVFLRLLRAHPEVRWVHGTAAGVDALLIPEILETDVILTHSRGIHDRTVSEFSMGLILAAAKHLPEIVEAQSRREWLPIVTTPLTDATLTIVGYGEIGHALAKRARAFDMRILAVRRHPAPDDLADEVVGPDRLHEVLGQADYVVLATPSTPETRRLFGEAEFRAMKPSAYFINVGRGDLVDEEALTRELERGSLAGALLDTFDVEPLPSDHPFWSNPKVVVSPHAGGVRTRPGAFKGRAMNLFMENLAHFQAGEPLRGVVDKKLGY